MSNAIKKTNRVISICLALVIVVSVALACYSLLKSEKVGSLPPQAVASVGEQIITRADYQRALQAANADHRTPLGAEGLREILNRLVNEALLVQYGLDHGLIQQPSGPREELVGAVRSEIRAEAYARTISETEVHNFYSNNAALFRGPDLLNIAPIFSRTQEQATAVRAAMESGDDWEVIRLSAGSDGIPVPANAAPPEELRDYIGPMLTQEAQKLVAGESSGPFSYQDGFVVLKMVDRHSAEQPPLAQVATAVRTEMHRREAERLLQKRLAALHQHYQVVIADNAS